MNTIKRYTKIRWWSFALFGGLSVMAKAQVIPIVDGGGNRAQTHVLSGNGQVAVGDTGGLGDIYEREFSFSEISGYNASFLGTLPDDYVAALVRFNGVDFDGSKVAGTLYEGEESNSRAFHWDSDSGFTLIGSPDGGGEADAISRDGKYVVGDDDTGSIFIGGQEVFAYNESFIWSADDGIMHLGYLGEGIVVDEAPNSETHDVNDDGNVVVGYTERYDTGEGVAFAWVRGVGLQELKRSQAIFELNDDGEYSAIALAISASGARIAGSIGNTAVKWDGVDAEPDILFLGEAYDINADGSVIVGGRIDYNVSPAGGDRAAIRWNEETGAQTVGEWLAGTGVEVGDISQYKVAVSVSDDGNTVLLTGDIQDDELTLSALARSGDGIPEEDDSPIVVDTPTPNDTPTEDPDIAVGRGGDGVLEMNDDLVKSLFTGFNTQSLVRQLPGMTLNGAHHRLLLDTPVGATGWHTWATGDFSTHDQLDADQVIGEVGASRNLGSEDLRLGIGLGHSAVDQDMAFGGSSDIDGDFVVAELNYRVPQSTVVLSALAYYGEWDADVTRGYLNAGLLDSSRGSTDIRTMAFRLRADWQDAYKNGKWSVTPRIAYSGIDTKGKGYTETGGGFPVRFDEQNNYEHEIRLGADIDYTINERTELRTLLEAVHRIDDASDLSGTIIGLNDFSYPTIDLRDTWGRAGFEVSHQLAEGQLIRASLFGSTRGADATVSGSLSYNLSF